jgi:hypothetical protein
MALAKDLPPNQNGSLPNPETVASVVSEALKSRSPRRRYPAAREAEILTLLKKLGPAQLLDKGIRKQFGLEAA